MPTKTETPYALLERAALHDLAARVLADPDSSAAHVEGATKRLTNESPDALTMAERARERLTGHERVKLRALLHKLTATSQS